MDAPYFHFYPREWLSDTATVQMTVEEVGAYIRLILHLWTMAPGCTVPDDDVTLARIVDVNVNRWKRLRKTLVDSPSPPFKSDQGRITCPLLEREIDRRHAQAISENKYGRLHGAEWDAIRQRVFERDDYTCRYCGARGGELECDHVMPISRGGSNDLTNLVTACSSCNRKKHAKTPEEWLV